MMLRSVGIDLTSVDEVSDSIRVFGDRYLNRVYTRAELDDCGANPRRLAARFAAKEATMKALACSDRLPWHSIVVDLGDHGRPSLKLSGAAAELSRRRGADSLSVSFTYGASHAAAIVLTEAS